MRVLVLGALLVLGACIQPAQAALVTFSATLDGAQSGTASLGTGVGTATLDDVTGVMTINGTFTGLTGISSNAHVHGLAAPGVSAGILVPLTFTAASSGTFSGMGTLTAPNIAGAIAGQTYINIHSTVAGGGEIRGQLLVSAVPEPSSAALLGMALSLPAFIRRRRR